MNRSTKGTLAVAAGVLLLAGAGAIAVGASTASVPSVVSVSQQQWAVLVVAIGLMGYAAAIVVAAFGKRRPRGARS
jgi:hypothetical protein